MNGSSVIARTRDTIFVRLPDAAQRECGTCRCSYCAEHPECKPMWDTLAIAANKPVEGSDYTWTVHMPDPNRVREAIACGIIQGPLATTVLGGRKR